jgi:hypothetical protein
MKRLIARDKETGTQVMKRLRDQRLRGCEARDEEATRLRRL